MAKRKTGNREIVKMKSTESPHMFTTMKNKRNTPDRIELRRYDPVLRKHVMYKESR
jgi:large subunit ribosomal protein L33